MRRIDAPTVPADRRPDGEPGPGRTASAAPAVPQVTPLPDAPDSGLVLELTGASILWSVSTLNAPAEKTFAVELTNQDDYRHDIAVYTLPNGPEPIFQSVLVEPLESELIEVPGLPAGTYEFICSLHTSTMRGSLVIEEPGGR